MEEFIELAACVAIMAFAPEALMGVTLETVGSAAAVATGLETATAVQAANAYGAAAANSVQQGSVVSLGTPSPHNLDKLMNTFIDLNNLEIDANTQALADEYRNAGVVTKFILNHPMLTKFFTDARTTKVLNFLGNNQYIDALNAGAESGVHLEFFSNYSYNVRWGAQIVYGAAKGTAFYAMVGDLAATVTAGLIRGGVTILEKGGMALGYRPLNSAFDTELRNSVLARAAFREFSQPSIVQEAMLIE